MLVLLQRVSGQFLGYKGNENTHTHIYIYIYIYIYIFSYTHTHTYTYKSLYIYIYIYILVHQLIIFRNIICQSRSNIISFLVKTLNLAWNINGLYIPGQNSGNYYALGCGSCKAAPYVYLYIYI